MPSTASTQKKTCCKATKYRFMKRHQTFQGGWWFRWLKSSWPKRNENFRTAFGTGLSAEEFHDIFFALGGPCLAQKRRASAEAVKEQGSEQQLLDSCTWTRVMVGRTPKATCVCVTGRAGREEGLDSSKEGTAHQAWQRQESRAKAPTFLIYFSKYCLTGVCPAQVCAEAGSQRAQAPSDDSWQPTKP